jgi:predicted AlkP superfamily phosphohydrolase/phosphomutase
MSNWAALPQVYAPYVFPAHLQKWLARRFGRTLWRMNRRLSEEMYVPQSLDRLMALTDRYVDTARRMADVAVALMESESWNLFISVLSAAHRGGHELWDSSGVSDGDGPVVEGKLREALRRTYVACDEAIGRHIEAAGANATVLVFTLHGMSANTSRSNLLEPMLRRIISGKPIPALPPRLGALKRLRRLIPHSARLAFKSRLPLSLQDRLSVFWRMGRRDWSGTLAFPLTADVNGYIQINLRGREARGIVQPGAEYDALCRRIAEGLKTFVDADTNEPIVESVTLTDEYFANASRRADLPDLVIRWASSPAARHRRVVSPQFGAIDCPAPGKIFNGRSGNHSPEACLLAAGNGIAPGSSIDGAHILDLPPTVYALFELPPPPHMTGRAIPSVTHAAGKVP